MGFWRRVKRGLEAARESVGPGSYACLGTKLACPVCAHEVFAEGSVLLNTVRMALLEATWADKRATTLRCIRCSHILWFAQKVERVGSVSKTTG